jgi:hypothetical protein
VLADRLDRRRTLLMSQYLQMATSAALAALMYFHVVQIWHILTLSFITGVAQSFGGPRVSGAHSLARRQERSAERRRAQFHSSSTSRACSVRCCLPRRSRCSQNWGYDEPQAMNACFLLNSLSFVVVINTLMALHVKHIPPVTIRRHA